MHHDLILDIALAPVKNPTAKVVLLALATYSNAEGVCFPSHQRLSKDTHIPTRSVIRAMQWLEDNGYIKTQRRTGSYNLYVITSMEEQMEDETTAKLAHEVESNITQLDISKKTNSNLTTSTAKLAHPHDTPAFLAFWQAYPRRVGKGSARTAFSKAIKYTDANEIIQGAIAYAAYCKEMGTERQYIPHASTWLNGERWDDELEVEVKENWGGALDGL